MGKRNLWIFNHYAVDAALPGEHRHFHFARRLQDLGYAVTVFSSSVLHGTEIDLIESDDECLVDESSGVRFVYLKTRKYSSNGKQRILGMMDYCKGVMNVSKKFDRPDVIYASSPHPLSCVAAIVLSRKHKSRCVCEVRDLWPESFVAYGMIKLNNPALKVLYKGERWIYKHCDALVFTMPRGYDYIVERGWGRHVPREKVFHICNGIDLALFEERAQSNDGKALLAHDEGEYCITYCGTVAPTHPLMPVLEAFKILQDRGETGVVLRVFGAGEQLEELKSYCADNGLSSVAFCGKAKPQVIPSIMRYSDANLIAVQDGPLTRFGVSWLKLSECLAAARPILLSQRIENDPVTHHSCGVVADGSPQDIADAIICLSTMSKEEAAKLSDNAKTSCRYYDIDYLVKELKYVLDGGN